MKTLSKLLVAVVLVAAIGWWGSAIPALASPEDFIAGLAPVAVPIVQSYGLYPSVFLAQAALESGWGESTLARYYNLFGRKCGIAPCVFIPTLEYRNDSYVTELHPFQVYESLEEAVHDYCQKYFRKYDSGHPVFLLDLTSPQAFIDGITTAPRPYSRYATDPKYGQKLRSIIRDYKLEGYDERY